MHKSVELKSIPIVQPITEVLHSAISCQKALGALYWQFVISQRVFLYVLRVQFLDRVVKFCGLE